MSLRTRTLLTVLTTVSVLTIGLFAFSKIVLMGSFQQLELREAQNNVDRARNTVLERFQYLEAKLADWARWDDAFTFVQDGNADFTSANLNDSAGQNMRVNHLIYYNNERKVMGDVGWDLVKDEPMPVSPSIFQFFEKNDYFFDHSDMLGFRKALVLFDGKPAFVVSAGVITSEFKGPPAGTLVFVSYLTPEMVGELSKVVKLDMEARTWDLVQGADGHWPLAKNLTPQNFSSLQAVDDSTMVAHLLFTDWEEKPAVVFQVKLNRDIMGVGVKTVQSLLAGVGIFSLVLAIALMLSLESNVIRRVVKLGQQVTEIGTTHRAGARVEVKGHDEITTLSVEINGMLGSIEEKTKAIQAILDHVAFGLLLTDKDGEIRSGYSRSTVELFQKAPDTSLSNQPIWQLLQLNERDTENFSSLYQQCFESSYLADELVAQLPARHKLGDATLMLTGSPIFDEKGELESVLFSISDITRLVRAEQENSHNRSLLRILRSRDTFADLVTRVIQEGTDRSSIDTLRQKGISDDHIMKVVRRNLHTWKGDFSVYGLRQFADDLHHLEDCIQSTDQAKKDIGQFGKAIETFLKDNQKLLGLDVQRLQEKSYDVYSQQLRSLSELAMTEKGSRALSLAVLQFVRQTRSKSAGEIFGHMIEGATDLASRQAKKVRFVWKGEKTLLSDEFKEVYDSFIHLFRNAVDHGIEGPGERQGKSEVSTITFTVEETDQHYRFELQDDGKGIDREVIKKKAIKSNLLTAAEWDAMTQDEQLRIILKSGFSTRDVVSDISGRGIGMDAVESSVVAAGGKIEISTVLGKGSCFRIQIPKPASLELDKRAA